MIRRFHSIPLQIHTHNTFTRPKYRNHMPIFFRKLLIKMAQIMEFHKESQINQLDL